MEGKVTRGPRTRRRNRGQVKKTNGGEYRRRRGCGAEEGKGSHCCQVEVLASHLKPGSESLERMMSLGEPKIRLHSTICRSRGSCEVILKNLLV